MEYGYIVENNIGEYLKYKFLDDESFEIETTSDIAEAYKYEYVDEIEMDFEHYLYDISNEIKPHKVLKVDEANTIITTVFYEDIYDEYMNNDF